MKNVMNTIPVAISSVANKFASKTALFLNNGNKISYNDMMWDVSMTSRALKEQGVTNNSKVALFMDNSPQSVVSFLAITRMGAVAILLNYEFGEKRIKEILAEEKPDVIFVSDYKLNYALGTENASILAIDDNRLLKQVSRQVKNSITEVEEKDDAVVTYSLSENGNFIRKCYTQKAFVEMSSEKANVSNPVNSIVDSLKSFIFPIFNGLSVNTSV